MKKNILIKELLVLIVIFSLSLIPVFSQNNLRTMITVSVLPDKPGWDYKLGETAIFNVTVSKFGKALENVKIKYELGLEKMPPIKTETLILKNGTLKIDGGTLIHPGFLRCQVYVEVDGFKYEDFATAAFEPQKIKTVAERPSDFTKFWENAKSELAKIPVNPVMVLVPEACTENVNIYYVNFANFKGRIYGVLSIPKKEGKYPAILNVPGAGIRPYPSNPGLAEKGIISLSIGIHGIPVNLSQNVYKELSAGALLNYYRINLDDRDNYYYKRVYLGCVRSVDFIFTLPQFNGKDIAVTGGSQGGALSLVTASLDSRIKYLGCLYPALCDLTGYLHGRAGGWPALFQDSFTNKPEKIKTAGYYDVVNFARSVKVPGFYSWGYNDNTCPPTSTFAAYNEITAPKELFIVQDTRHWAYPEQLELLNRWLIQKLLNP
jgi:cephalosporin-C deacetylase-like acetyl esterase